MAGIFQLPLSGSQEIERSVVDLIDGVELSTPSLGITIPQRQRRGETDCYQLSTPSLGITCGG